ncbi:unnamed protein product (macronuclear) [Paramecium tetraurelia]|uniref:Uncharacterized protein n=1 Tax=Paramecium tetraurelia TaxID=5888 RepID=A0DSL9_PARTE|nr:uncharacterized protein GSPATT00039741001 [Paramecium tetraurelia]CAK86036.1 unnamed protein product [Paramecium tetraurelia]|eukprot:XP_001453433.1 hypothetical protein (macronuclear) [Paramecium tetraurelia strain d4-2]
MSLLLTAAQNEKFNVYDVNLLIGQVKLKELHSLQYFEQFQIFPLNKLDGFIINFVVF